MSKELIKKMIDALPDQKYSIGIGVTEHNRPEMFNKTLEEIKKYSPLGCKIVIVDDASIKPVEKADYRFEKNVGIAVAKNKCIELLYLSGCEHIFLFDSDTYPICDNWWEPYVKSKEPHLNYIFKDFSDRPTLNDTQEIYRDSEIVAYSHVRGCMMYYHRSALEMSGGMNPIFGKWGYEHPNLSDRIFMLGLTSFRYMDVVNSSELIYSADEHRQVKTTVAGAERQKCIAANKNIYQSLLFDKTFVPFIEKRNIFLTCYFTSVSDPQKGKVWEAKAEELNPLIKSLKETELVILNDCFDDFKGDKHEFVRVETNVNPYIQRWISYRKYLINNRDRIENVFCIDGTDVEVLREPEWSRLNDRIFTGDENEVLKSTWMINMHPIKQLTQFFNDNPDKQLLNAGILGGSVDNLIEFMRQVIDFWCLCGIGKTDMGVFNYIARSNWEDKLVTGRQVCTVFKSYEKDNKISWFKHK